VDQSTNKPANHETTLEASLWLRERTRIYLHERRSRSPSHRLHRHPHLSRHHPHHSGAKIGRGSALSDFICRSSRTSSYDQSASMSAFKSRTSCGRPSICSLRNEGNDRLLADWLQNKPSNWMRGSRFRKPRSSLGSAPGLCRVQSSVYVRRSASLKEPRIVVR
jgi:hypothetical protein